MCVHLLLGFLEVSLSQYPFGDIEICVFVLCICGHKGF